MSHSVDFTSLTKIPFDQPLPLPELNVALASPPFIPIAQALNLRTLTSPSLPPNLIFRSGSLTHLSPSSLTLLKADYNVTTIFDLRSKKEREKAPSPEIDGVETVWIPSLGDTDEGKQILSEVKYSDFATNEGVDGFVKMYGNVLRGHGGAFRAVFERLREGGGGVLFHCTAGKDRTGILAALILGLMDTPSEIIAQDYEITRIGVEPFREHLLGVLLHTMLGKTDATEIFAEPGFVEMCGVRGLTMVAVMDWINEKWGSGTSGNGLYPGVEGYLVKELGFSVEELESIKQNLAVSVA